MDLTLKHEHGSYRQGPHRQHARSSTDQPADLLTVVLPIPHNMKHKCSTYLSICYVHTAVYSSKRFACAYVTRTQLAYLHKAA